MTKLRLKVINGYGIKEVMDPGGETETTQALGG